MRFRNGKISRPGGWVSLVNRDRRRPISAAVRNQTRFSVRGQPVPTSNLSTSKSGELNLSQPLPSTSSTTSFYISFPLMSSTTFQQEAHMILHASGIV